MVAPGKKQTEAAQKAPLVKKAMKEEVKRPTSGKKLKEISQPEEYNIERDPDMPADAVNSNVIIEEIEMNGRKQKVYRKTYQLVDGKTKVITRTENHY